MKATTLGVCGADDERRLRRLAEVDSAAPLTGKILAAEQEGELRAPIALGSRRVIADPFHRTADLVELLLTRVAQIDRQEAGTGSRVRARVWGSRGRYVGSPPVWRRRREAPSKAERPERSSPCAPMSPP